MTTAIILAAVIAVIVILYFLSGNKNAFGNAEILENDAKRFAKLLVSQISLYETYKVKRGLKNNNLYESLRDEIEEARKTFRPRFPNYELELFFDEALVDILADGDKAKMGLIPASNN